MGGLLALTVARSPWYNTMQNTTSIPVGALNKDNFKFRLTMLTVPNDSEADNITSELSYLMAEAVAVPQHKLFESPNSRSIEVLDWFITASTNPISNASDLNTLQASTGFPLPEMTFGRNFLTLEHRPSAWKYSFTAEAALKTVRNGELQDGDGGVKVGYADKWMQSRYVYAQRKSRVPCRSSTGLHHHHFFQCQRPCLRNHMTGPIPRRTLATKPSRRSYLVEARRLGILQNPRMYRIVSQWPNLHVQIPFCFTRKFLCSRMNCTTTVLQVLL